VPLFYTIVRSEPLNLALRNWASRDQTQLCGTVQTVKHILVSISWTV